jgi:hypothetical protein
MKCRWPASFSQAGGLLSYFALELKAVASERFEKHILAFGIQIARQ